MTRGDGEGPGVGDCAITEHMKNAVSIINNTTLLEAAILEIDVGELNVEHRITRDQRREEEEERDASMAIRED